jgi:hypothetical protein
MSQYEYGIIRDGDDPSDLHRGPWTVEDCLAWIKECEDMGFKHGMWLIVRREVSPWSVM